jgi:drug/metabolite transporter (DMT)-like permease
LIDRLTAFTIAALSTLVSQGCIVHEPAQRGLSGALKAKLLLVLLSLAWGVNWPVTRIALNEIPPWTLRACSLGIGALALYVLARMSGRSLWIPPGRPRLHLAVASIFNVVLFNILTAFGQLGSTTSRVIIIAYSMPIWATLMAWPLLGERLDARRSLSLALCVGGLAILVWPLLGSGVPLPLMLALASALGWAMGTVYLKWACVDADPAVSAIWQIILGFVVIAICQALFEHAPLTWPLKTASVLAVTFNGLIGVGLAYFVWFSVMERLPAGIASLGLLLVPVVGIVSAAILVGDRPTSADLVGFALIFAAAATVLLQPGARLERDSTPAP